MGKRQQGGQQRRRGSIDRGPRGRGEAGGAGHGLEGPEPVRTGGRGWEDTLQSGLELSREEAESIRELPALFAGPVPSGPPCSPGNSRCSRPFDRFPGGGGAPCSGPVWVPLGTLPLASMPPGYGVAHPPSSVCSWVSLSLPLLLPLSFWTDPHGSRASSRAEWTPGLAEPPSFPGGRPHTLSEPHSFCRSHLGRVRAGEHGARGIGTGVTQEQCLPLGEPAALEAAGVAGLDVDTVGRGPPPAGVSWPHFLPPTVSKATPGGSRGQASTN